MVEAPLMWDEKVYLPLAMTFWGSAGVSFACLSSRRISESNMKYPTMPQRPLNDMKMRLPPTWTSTIQEPQVLCLFGF